MASPPNVSAIPAITGGALVHMIAASGGASVTIAQQTITLTGTPAFSLFAQADGAGILNVPFNTYSGLATGAKYSASNGGWSRCGRG